VNKNLKNIGEYALIDLIKKWMDKKKDKSILGIGDDAAQVLFKSNKIIASVDALVENIHFTRKITSFYDLGYKSLAVNISDMSAMGAKSLFALITFSVTKDMTFKNIKDFYKGFKTLADKFNIKLIGGDTVKSKRDIFVSVTILGESYSKTSILRSGAKCGDYLCVTGTFGDAGYGLNLLQKNIKDKFFYQRFNRPDSRCQESMFIAKNNIASSMMDASDGLVSSIYELMNKSKTGCEIFYNKIPVSKKLKSKTNIMNYILYGGEDYELVFTVHPEKIDLVKSKMKNMSIIGRVTNNKKIKFLDENNKEINVKYKTYDALK
jgi:thiamine-monophosphate kinase